MPGVPHYCWITRLGDLARLVRDLPERIAVDLEADSLYRYRERICLIQISTPDENWIIDPLALPHLEPLRPIFESRDVEKVLHGADYDIRLLKKLAGIHPAGLFDTMLAGQLLGSPHVGLSDLIQDRLSVQLEKRFQKADWGTRPLSQQMLHYAIWDCCHLLPLRDVLFRELQDKGRLGWAQEEFESLCRVEPKERGRPDVMKTKGAHVLDARGRAVLQELIDWREHQAQKRDVPPYKVIGTGTLVELAQKRPTSSDSILKIHGITPKAMRIWGDGLIKALEAGLAAPLLPKHSKSSKASAGRLPGAGRRLRKLKHIRDKRAAELNLDPGVLCPNASLRTIAEVPSERLDRQITETLKVWQRQILGDDIREALRG